MSRQLLLLLVSTLCLAAVACGPSGRNGNVCFGGDCSAGSCTAGDSRGCYPGEMATINVGPCVAGSQSCTSAGQWGDCVGSVTPVAENCGDHLDNNCNGAVDENTDADGDGFTTCEGDCCDSVECSNPADVNPGAFDVAGDNVDNDCDGSIDNTATVCDQALPPGSTDGLDYAKAIDLCQMAAMTDKKWGVISAVFTRADGTLLPNPGSHAILPHYGTAVLPKVGSSLMLLSTGFAAAVGDPGFDPGISSDMGTDSPFPADFVAAHAGSLPNAPGCPEPLGSTANDPIMLTLTIRVPTNAKSFSINSNFFSDEFPEYTCTAYNDFFVMLLDSTYAGTPANPTDKNLAVFTKPGTMMSYPVGVNLAAGNTGLFTQCVNGSLGCAGLGSTTQTISTCIGTTDLAGTGLDTPAPDQCDPNSLMGGGTGWLTTTGNVRPGEIIKLRIAIWDTSDPVLDSLAVIDGFKWSAQGADPGTVILKTD